MKLSPDQAQALRDIRAWFDDTCPARVFSLAGYAGTGKSMLLGVLAQELLARKKMLAFAAFTGKAASVLRRRLSDQGIASVAKAPKTAGVKLPFCGTLHALLFHPCPGCADNVEHTHGPGCAYGQGVTDVAAGAVAPCSGCAAEAKVKETTRSGACSACHGRRFFRRPSLDRPYDLLIIDEASMVDDSMLQAVLAYAVPVLAVGDHGQLPPVRGAGTLMRQPDVKLEKIHRQALGNPIIRLAAHVRASGDLDLSLADGKRIVVYKTPSGTGGPLSSVGLRDIGEWSRVTERRAKGPLDHVLIAWTNKARCALNRNARAWTRELTDDDPPRLGEPVVCLRNEPPIYNGMRGVLATKPRPAGSAQAPRITCDVDFAEDGFVAQGVGMSCHQFLEEKTIDYDAVRAMGLSFGALGGLFDFGYAMTCHKMQGSQAKTVGLVLEPGLWHMNAEDRARWLYTAITRAAETLTVFT